MTSSATRPEVRGRADPPHLANAKRGYSSPDRVIDTIRQALIVLDEKLHVISANRAFYRAFAVMPDETTGKHLADVDDHRLDVSALRDFLGLFQPTCRHRGL